MYIPHLLIALSFLLFVSPVLAADPSAAIYRQAGNWQLYGDAPDSLDFALGVFDIDEKASGAARIEWHGGGKAAFIGPAAGMLANTDGGVFGYGGIFADIAWKRLMITPFWGGGFYEEGDGKDLGGVFQFRSAITIGCRFADGSRAGIHFAHISNADLYNDENPGEQDLFVTYVRPF